MNNVGIDKHSNNDDYREWHRALVHSTIKMVLEPLVDLMRTGIRLYCADGKERLCFPILCQHIGDMEEQWLLACMKKPDCPKCIIINPGTQLHDPRNRTIRTDAHAANARERQKHGEITLRELMDLGYHKTKPYASEFPHNGILDSLCPDLLHGVSKCFSDYIMKRFIWPYMQYSWKKKGVAASLLRMEFDSRFALVPSYMGLRRFKDGILTQNHHWTVHEHKEMMKVTLAVLAGICPPDGLELLREYLHIHRLSHYHVHSEESLGWLESAISVFWSILKRPTGGFIKAGLITNEFDVQRLHYFMHYAESVREKGSLTSYSTDRTEIWHKPIKSAFRRSNKGKDSMRFILKEQSVLSAFQSRLGMLDLDESQTNGTDSNGGNSNGVDANGAEKELEELSDKEDSNSDNEELGLPREIGTAEQITALHKSEKAILWPRNARPGFRQISTTDAESKTNFGNANFSKAVKQYLLEAHPGDSSSRNEFITVSIYSNITIRYPLWTPAEVSAHTPESSEMEKRREYKYVLPGRYHVAKEILRAGVEEVYPRRSCVLVSTPERVPRGQQNSMSQRRVAQLLCLFTTRIENAIFLQLAFVHWFETKGQVSPSTGMYTVRFTSRFGVIPVDKIERGVHLVPKFGSEIGPTTEMKKKIDAERDEKLIKEGELTKSNVWLDVYAHYEDYLLNNWIDPHAYKNIF